MGNSATNSKTLHPKNGKRWEHKELEAALNLPYVARVKEQGGLYGVVRRTKTGTASVIFRWRFRTGEKLDDYTAGTWPSDSLKSIREAHESAVALHDAGKNPNAEKKLQKLNAASAQTEQLRVHEEETVCALALKWQQVELVKRGDKGRKDNGAEVMRSFGRDVFPTLGSSPINSLSKSSWLSLFDEVKDRAPRMAARLFADLSQFLEWCARREYIEVSPLHKIRKSDIAAPYKERQRFLWNPDSGTPAAELLELSSKLPAAKLNRKNELAIWLILSTGCRVGEISKAKWANVDFDNREWTFPAENTKTKVNHRVYISDFTNRHLRALNKITGETPWCFPSDLKDDHISEKNLTKQFTDRQRSVSLKNRSKATETLVLTGGTWGSHDLRRTAARMMSGLGVDPMVIEGCISHVMEKLKRTYQGGISWEKKREAWVLLGKKLDLLLTPNNPTLSKFPIHVE